ncbi:MAG: class I SAM-dependent methyltransferase [Acidimicrobiales bacterium]|nr:class I SAM-dependent methyltransferase [Acidimicrobiales bacterium]
MGFYRDNVLPRLVDKALSNDRIGKWRVRCMEGLAGVVVEPGFGSGTNLPFYPEAVEKVYAVDPAVLGQKLAAERLAQSSVVVEFIGLDGQSIPLDDNSCDAGLLTFSLCTIPDPMRALHELRRVIKPDGALHFLEHGVAPEPSIRKWQGRIDPVQKRLFDGCHVSRDHPALLEAAGFTLDWVEHRYAEGPKPWSYFYVGRALNTPDQV